jgi:hypothetical protein
MDIRLNSLPSLSGIRRVRMDAKLGARTGDFLPLDCSSSMSRGDGYCDKMGVLISLIDRNRT